MSAPRVLVTGGGGFVGSHLVTRLVADGADVTVYDAAPPHDDAVAAVRDSRFVRGDIRDTEALTAATAGADVVYHLAAVVGVDNYLARPLDVIDTNFSGTRSVLEAALRADAKVVVASTSEVYGKNPEVPWREDGDRVLGPTSADRWTYSTSKALTEHLVLAFARQEGLDATIVRYFNVYGPRQRPAFVVSRSVHRALNGLPLAVYDDGKQTRCFTFVDDAVDGTVLAAAHPGSSGEVFNIGSMVESTIGETVALVADLTGELTGTAAEIVHVDTAEKLGSTYEDLARRVPDNTKARTVLGWDCPTTLATGLERTIAWARDNPWWLATPDSGAR